MVYLMGNQIINIKGSKILIVDDVQENLELLSKILESDGFEIAYATSGKQAIEVASLFLPQLILLDVMMPGIDGFETCKQLKSLNKLKEIPVIFVTGKNNIQDVVTGFNVGGIDYITKPIHHEEVLLRVETHLQLKALINLRDDLIDALRERNMDLAKVTQLKNEKLELSKNFEHFSELVGELSHEIATPLGVINTATTTIQEYLANLNTSFLEDKISKKTLGRYIKSSGDGLDIILSNMEHVIELVASFKKIIVGEFSHKEVSVDICEHINDVKNLLLPKFKNTPHQIIILCSKPISLFSDPGIISQILINLIGNSLVHAFTDKQAGTVNVFAFREDESVVIEVSDNGCGLNEEQRDKLFQKYYTTKENEGGSGLGLYIVHKLIKEKLGGSITVDSKQGVGTTFTLRLPNKKIE